MDARPELEAISIFARVVEAGSFSRAARALGVPTSTVSRSIARLEDALGVRLLQRTTRAVAATSEGRALLARVEGPLLAIREAIAASRGGQDAPRGTLRVSAPTDHDFVAEIAARYVERHPEVTLDLNLSSRRVDLVAEGFDVAIRAGVLRDSSLVARKLGDSEAWFVAGPAYVARHGEPSDLADLERHAFVANAVFAGKPMRIDGPKGPVQIKLGARLVGDDFAFVRAALVAGAGIGLVPRLICVRDLADGRLVRILPRYEVRGSAIHVVYPSAKNVPAKVSAFRDVAVEVFRAWCSI